MLFSFSCWLVFFFFVGILGEKADWSSTQHLWPKKIWIEWQYINPSCKARSTKDQYCAMSSGLIGGYLDIIQTKYTPDDLKCVIHKWKHNFFPALRSEHYYALYVYVYCIHVDWTRSWPCAQEEGCNKWREQTWTVFFVHCNSKCLQTYIHTYRWWWGRWKAHPRFALCTPSEERNTCTLGLHLWAVPGEQPIHGLDVLSW